MENTLYQSLIAEFSAAERPTFEKLLAKLELLDGNLQDLSEQEKEQLAQLAAIHKASKKQSQLQADERLDEGNSLSAAETSEEYRVKISNVSETHRPTETEFGAYLLENINESLCQGGASTADAIRYAFHNKWMPEKLKNRDVCEDIFYRYNEDIELANLAIQKNSPSHANNDTVVAVGLAWFTNLYLCYQLVEAEGDI